MKCVFLSIIIFSGFYLFAQTPKLDSLRIQYENANHDSDRVELTLLSIQELYFINPDTVIPLSKKIIKLIDGFIHSIPKNKQREYLIIKANSLNNIGALFNQKGDIPNAILYFNKSLKIKEKLQDTLSIAKTYNNLGFVYQSMNDFNSALQYLDKSLLLKTKINDEAGIAATLLNIGSVYDSMNDTIKAMINYRKSIKLYQLLNDKKGVANVFNNIAFLYDEAKNLEMAKSYYLKAFEIRNKINDQQGIAETGVNLANTFLTEGDFKTAKIYGENSFAIARKIGFPEYIKRASLLLSQIYRKNGNFENALNMYDLYVVMKDSINRLENKEAVVRNKYQNDYKIKVMQDSIKIAQEKKMEKLKHETEIKKQKFYIYGGVVTVIFLIIIAIILIKSNIRKKRDNTIIEEQKQIVEQKQNEILDSINYAKRIQESFLASKTEISKWFDDYFLIYLPKDIVSGDFYWCEKVGSKVYLAICDCTGHGIPGAFMSLLNISLLNEAVLSKGLTQPNEILNFVRKIVILGLNKEEQSKGNDGMDCILFCFDSDNPSVITYAAANNSPSVINNNAIHELPYDKMPVGKSPMENVDFRLFQHEVANEDIIVLSTDGFGDQFGASNAERIKAKAVLSNKMAIPEEQKTAKKILATGKKFKHKTLLKSIAANKQNNLTEIQISLEKEINEWKMGYEQTDDITVMVFKLKKMKTPDC